ncbi:MAG: hypothetical protein II234_00025 [Clostridia bacterium]|nr:hypothetical protein [Clostridia bacterium]
MESYVTKAFNMLMRNKHITHHEIKIETNCNDNYSVMAGVKNRLKKLGIELYSKPLKNSKGLYYWIEVA